MKSRRQNEKQNSGVRSQKAETTLTDFLLFWLLASAFRADFWILLFIPTKGF
jgi:hypothetical protein